MRHALSAAVPIALLAGLLAGSAAADAPPQGGPDYRRGPPREAGFWPAPSRRGTRSPHRPYRAFADERSVRFGRRYEAEPPYFLGTGDASPSRGRGTSAVTLSEYREAYIGRGLVYNVPPQPFIPASYVIRVRY